MVPCPADTMFRNEIRLAAVKALAKCRFREALDALAAFFEAEAAADQRRRQRETRIAARAAMPAAASASDVGSGTDATT